MIGNGGAENAAKAIAKRKYDVEDALKEEEVPDKGLQSPAPRKLKDASAGAMRDYQMQQAIEMVRKKKSSKRTDYQ
jgi:hypothetical protein